MIPQFFLSLCWPAKVYVKLNLRESGIGCIYFFLFGNVNHIMLNLQEMIFPREKLK
jgi:hypothetical protein